MNVVAVSREPKWVIPSVGAGDVKGTRKAASWWWNTEDPFCPYRLGLPGAVHNIIMTTGISPEVAVAHWPVLKFFCMHRWGLYVMWNHWAAEFYCISIFLLCWGSDMIFLLSEPTGEFT